jgi:hypothetical protein
MLLLTFNTAISNEIASGAFLQFDVIHLTDSTGSTTHHHVALFFTTHHKKSTTSTTEENI